MEFLLFPYHFGTKTLFLGGDATMVHFGQILALATAIDNILVAVEIHIFVLQKVYKKRQYQGDMYNKASGYHFHIGLGLLSTNLEGKNTLVGMFQNSLCQPNLLCHRTDLQDI